MRVWPAAFALLHCANAGDQSVFDTLEGGVVGIVGSVLDSMRKQIVGETAATKAVPRDLKIFVAGLGRSGTGSLALALNKLGYKTFMGIEDAISISAHVEAFYEGQLSGVDILKIMTDQGYDAAGFDFFNCLYEEAAEIPGVKVVLTVRDTPDAWAESWPVVGSHLALYQSRPFSFFPSMRAMQRHWLKMSEMATDGNAKDHPWNHSALRNGYIKHLESVRAKVPPERLLIFNVKEGWLPLCSFLDVEDCPSTPFPRVNDRAFLERLGYVFVAFTWLWALPPCLALLAGFACLRGVRFRVTSVKTKDL